MSTVASSSSTVSDATNATNATNITAPHAPTITCHCHQRRRHHCHHRYHRHHRHVPLQSDDEEADMTGIIAGSVVGAAFFLCIAGSLAWAKSQGRICKKPTPAKQAEMGPQAGNGAV